MNRTNTIRNDNNRRLRELRKEFEQIFWNLEETANNPSMKDYQIEIMFQNREIIKLLEALNRKSNVYTPYVMTKEELEAWKEFNKETEKP